MGGQHIYTAAVQHRKDKEFKNHPLPLWTTKFEGFEVRRDTPLPIRRKLAGLHQVQTTSSSVSTTSERMALLLEHIAEDPGARCSPTLRTCWLKFVLQLMKAMLCVQRFDCIRCTFL